MRRLTLFFNPCRKLQEPKGSLQHSTQTIGAMRTPVHPPNLWRSTPWYSTRLKNSTTSRPRHSTTQVIQPRAIKLPGQIHCPPPPRDVTPLVRAIHGPANALNFPSTPVGLGHIHKIHMPQSASHHPANLFDHTINSHRPPSKAHLLQPPLSERIIAILR